MADGIGCLFRPMLHGIIGLIADNALKNTVYRYIFGRVIRFIRIRPIRADGVIVRNSFTYRSLEAPFIDFGRRYVNSRREVSASTKIRVSSTS